MISVSTFSSKFSITEILLETFAPPRIATNGLSGLLTAFPKKSTSKEKEHRQNQLLRFNKVLLFIDENYSRPITNQELADIMYMSV
jgi:hypothetical protein